MNDDEVKAEFLNQLRILLAKYDAELSYSCESETEYRIVVCVDELLDDEGTVIRNRSEFDIYDVMDSKDDE